MGASDCKPESVTNQPCVESTNTNEASDPDNAVTVAAAGTQNVANYNTLRVTATNADPPPNPAEYRLSCTVSDGVDSVTVHHMVTVMIA